MQAIQAIQERPKRAFLSGWWDFSSYTSKKEKEGLDDLLLRWRLQQLSSSRSSERTLAAEALGQMGPKAKPAIPTLIKVLRKSGPLGGVRQAACKALGQIGSQALPEIQHLLTDADRDIRLLGLSALSAMGSQAAPAALSMLPLLVENDFEIRLQTIRTFGAIGASCSRLLPAVARVMLDDPHWMLRRDAAEAIGKFGIAALPVLGELSIALFDPEWTVRRVAIWTLEKLGPAANPIHPAIQKAAGDSDSLVRQAALRLLQIFANRRPS